MVSKSCGQFLCFDLVLAFVLLANQPARAQTFATLFNFGDSSASYVPHGSSPQSTLVEVSPGVFYGTTYLGGKNNCGTLFCITSQGQFTKLHDFTEDEGCGPNGQLIQSADGMLYGLTLGQLSILNLDPTLFRSDLKGNVTRLAYFHNNTHIVYATPATAGRDGSIYIPITLVPSPNAPHEPKEVKEVIYKYALDGTLSEVASPFQVAGGTPPLTLAGDGNLYGVVSLYQGKVLTNQFIQVSNAGVQVTATLQPYQNMIAIAQGSDGKLYMTSFEIVPDKFAAIDSIDLDGSNFQTVKSFCLNCFAPQTGFTLASDGSLYAGGGSGKGIFKITSCGQYADVYKFPTTLAYVESPSGLAAQGSDGLLYGELIGNEQSLPDYQGAIYTLDLGLPKPCPKITTVTASGGSSGTELIVAGEHLLGVTGVTLNGVAVPFVSSSGSFLTATVPDGAAAGTLTLATPNGTATFAPGPM
jgi:uncharacterized repeat protein (TIGR03803 family)